MSELRFRAERLDHLMTQQGLNDAQLAKRTGISKTMIHYLRTGGRSTTSIEKATKIASALGTTPDYFIGDGKTSEPPAADLPFVVHELSEVAKQLPDRRQRDLLLQARVYLEASQAARANPHLLVGDLLSMIREAGGDASEEQLLRLLTRRPAGGLLAQNSQQPQDDED